MKKRRYRYGHTPGKRVDGAAKKTDQRRSGLQGPAQQVDQGRAQETEGGLTWRLHPQLS